MKIKFMVYAVAFLDVAYALFLHHNKDESSIFYILISLCLFLLYGVLHISDKIDELINKNTR